MSEFTGTLPLVRLALRRDRVRLAIWIVGFAVVTALTARSIQDIYPTTTELEAYARTIAGNAAVIAFSGPDRELGTFGGRTAFEVWQYCFAVPLMSVFAVTRSLRAEEESGRAELLRATPVGRHAHSTAALLVGVTASVALGAGATLAALSASLEPGGSLVFGAALAMLGVSFAGIALIANQITTHARTANGIAGAVIGFTYLLRAVGDISAPVLSWLSPFGWSQASWPFSGDRWWPLLLALAMTGVFAAISLALEHRRDYGAGMLSSRDGPPAASRWLSGPLGLAWRLQRGSIAAWSGGVAAMALMMGPIVDDAERIVGENKELRELLVQISDAGLADIMLATLLAYWALAACGFGLQSIQRMRSEEGAGRAELVLAAGTGRLSWARAHLLVLAAGACLILLTGGAAMGLSYALAAGDLSQVARLVTGSLSYLPAVGTVVAAGLLAYGWRSRLMPAAWTVVAFAAVEMMLGGLLQMPGWLRDLSPLHHFAQAPVVSPSASALFWTVALTVAGLAGGLALLRRRDLSG